MQRALRSRTCFTLVLTLVFVGIAGVASADLVCLDLNDGLLGSPSLLYRLNVTFPGNNTASAVGTAFQGAATRVVTGGGALVGGQFEVSLQGTDIVAPDATGSTPVLVTHSTHVLLNGPQFTSGTFEAVHVRIFPAGQGIAESVSLSDGTAAIIPCPPQG